MHPHHYGPHLSMSLRTRGYRRHVTLIITAQCSSPRVSKGMKRVEVVTYRIKVGPARTSKTCISNWAGRRDSNPRPSDPQSDALTRLSYSRRAFVPVMIGWRRQVNIESKSNHRRAIGGKSEIFGAPRGFCRILLAKWHQNHFRLIEKLEKR